MGGCRKRCYRRLTKPMAHTADFRVDFNFPPTLLARCIEVVAQSRVFGVDDWNGTLERLASDSGYTHEQLANIPGSVFDRGSSSTGNPWPAMFILMGAVKRCLAGMIFPRMLIMSASGATAWTLLAAVSSGTIVGVALGFACSPWAATVLLAILCAVYFLLLVTGQARNAARRLAAVAYSAAETSTADAGTDMAGGSSSSREALISTLSRGNALAPTLSAAGGGLHSRFVRNAKKLEKITTLEKKHDEFGVDIANGESVEVIQVRFLHFTRFAPLDIGEKYIAPSAFAPWTAAEEVLLQKTVEKHDIGGGTTGDWRVVEEEFRGAGRTLRRALRSASSASRDAAAATAPAGSSSIRVRRSSGDLRRRYEEIKDDEQATRISAGFDLPRRHLQSNYRRVLPEIINREQHRNKAGIMMAPELLTVEQIETAAKAGVAEWKARVEALLPMVDWKADKALKQRRESGFTGAKHIKKIWERDVEGTLRKSLAKELWSTYNAERAAHVPLSARSLGRTLTRNSPGGAVSWGEFLSFHLQEPAQLHQDHVDEIILLPPAEQRTLIQKLLAVAVRDFREATAEMAIAQRKRDDDDEDGDSLAYLSRSLPAGHDSRVVNKIINDFDSLCVQVLAPGRTYRMSTEGGVRNPIQRTINCLLFL
jgi:hypothetical protein